MVNDVNEARTNLYQALHDWKDAGGDIERVMYALENLMVARIESAYRWRSSTAGDKP